MPYIDDRQWSDQFIPEIKRIVGPLLMSETPFEIDAEQAADLMVFKAKDMRIAARVRRPGYEQFAYEFTIRSRRDSGAETELSKIVNGWGDWMFYAHDGGEGTFSRWWLIDLDAFRASLIRSRGQISKGEKSNRDGTFFAWFDLRTFPANPSILVAGSHELHEAAA